MDQKIQSEIDNDLFISSSRLLDVEDDQDWTYDEMIPFQIEWDDVCSRISFMKENLQSMTSEQQIAFENLRDRFKSVAERLKLLNLENSFESSVLKKT